MALIIAAVLVGAAAAWLAFELRRAWSPESQHELREAPEPSPAPLERRTDREITALLSGVAEELTELRATVEQLRSTPAPLPVAAQPEPEPEPAPEPIEAILIDEPDADADPEPDPEPELEPAPPPPPSMARPRSAVDESSWPTEVDLERFEQLKLGRMLRDPQRYLDEPSE